MKLIFNAEFIDFYESKFPRTLGPKKNLRVIGYRQTDNVSLSITWDGSSYSFTATHANCAADTWTFNDTGSILGPPTPCQLYPKLYP